MNKKIRIFFYIVLGLTLLFIAVIVVTNTLIKNKVENFVTSGLPDHIQFQHESLTLDILEGTLTFLHPVVTIQNKETSEMHTKVTLDRFIIEDLSYWDYLFKDKIHIEDIKLKSPVIQYYQHKIQKNKDTTNISPLQLSRPVLIDELSIDNTKLSIFNGTNDSLSLYTQNLTVEVDDIFIDKQTLSRRLPLKYGKYTAKADTVFVKVGKFEQLKAGAFTIDSAKAVFTNIELLTKYSRSQLSQRIDKERDHYNVQVKSLAIENIDFGFNNRKFFAKSSLITLQQPDVKIFRNKLVADDTSIKPLYSDMLRNLPIDLTVEKMAIQDMALNYTEKVNPETDGGTITITNMNADISNVSNTYTSPVETKLKIDGTFMNAASFTADWSFDVTNKNDAFVFALSTKNLPAEQLNKFTAPNLKVKLEGALKEAYFTIDGNAYQSTVDMKIRYDNFKVIVMNKERDEKNWFLSTVANIFLSKNSIDDNDVYRSASGDVTRDRTKSVFNFIWLNVRKGLIKSLTGENREKE